MPTDAGPVVVAPDDAVVTPDQRRRAVAEILAAGLVRLKRRAALPSGTAKHSGPAESSESREAGLEVREPVRLTGCAVDTPRDPETRT